MSENLYDADVSTIDTSYPRVVAKLYDLEIVKASKEQNKAQTGDNVVLEFKTTSDSTSTTGEPVPIGFVIHHNISLVPTPKYDPRKPVALFMKALHVQGKMQDFLDNLSSIVGKVVPANVGIQKATAEYNERNTIRSFEVKA